MFRKSISLFYFQRLLAEVDNRQWRSLSKKRVQHYGYEFLYEVSCFLYLPTTTEYMTFCKLLRDYEIWIYNKICRLRLLQFYIPIVIMVHYFAGTGTCCAVHTNPMENWVADHLESGNGNITICCIQEFACLSDWLLSESFIGSKFSLTFFLVWLVVWLKFCLILPIIDDSCALTSFCADKKCWF